MPATSVAGAVTTALILLPLQLTATESNEPLNPLLSLPPHQGSVVLCALCASVVLFPYTTGYCLMLPPLRLTATDSTEPLNPLLSLTLSNVRRPLCALRLCGFIPVHHRLLPHASPAQINSHRFHRSTQSSFHPAHLQWPSSSVRSLLCGFIPQPTVFFIFSTTIINRRDAEFAET